MGYWMLKNIVTLKLHKGSFKLQGHSKALVQFRIPYQLWPYLLTNLLKTQPKLLPKNLTFRPLSEAFIRRSWYSVLPVLDTTGRRRVKFLGNNFGCVLSKLVNK